MFLSEETIDTIVDTALNEGTIAVKVVGISFQPTTSAGEANGELMFGGANPSKYTRQLTTV